MQIIDITDPDDLREGDIVTTEDGVRGQPGYVHRVYRIAEKNGEDKITRSYLGRGVLLGIRITEVRREVPDLPDHAGMLAFTGGGLAWSDGDAGFNMPWAVCDGNGDQSYLKTADLDNPVAATPVPTKELAALLAETRNGSNVDIAAAAFNLASVCRREWARAGVPAPEVTP